MNPFEMVVLIVAITAVAIFRAKYGIPEHRKSRKGRNDDLGINDAENDRLREELRMLKERVAVLERIATDNDRGLQLDREIEALRHRD
jgi:low affinity Fe/Cu permease